LSSLQQFGGSIATSPKRRIDFDQEEKLQFINIMADIFDSIPQTHHA
jgi:hypothetical protein